MERSSLYVVVILPAVPFVGRPIRSPFVRSTQPLTVGAGQWDMAPNKFYTNANVASGWAVLVCARQQFWGPGKVNAVAQAFAKGCTDCGASYFFLDVLERGCIHRSISSGINGMNSNAPPTIEWTDPNSDIKGVRELRHLKYDHR